MSEQLFFRIEGEFLTKLAREKCYIEGDFESAVRLLCTALQNDALSEKEVRHIAVDILDGYAEIRGLSNENDFGVHYLEKKDEKWSLDSCINKTKEEADRLREELQDLQEKYFFICENLRSYDLNRLNDEYFDCYEEYLFEDLVPEYLKRKPEENQNQMLSSVVKRMSQGRDDDYGWLEPDGTFHPVEWGEHEAWAGNWVLKNVPEDVAVDIWECGDYLAKQGWALLHNPTMGIAEVTTYGRNELTQKQKDFLFDYYMERACPEKANALFKDEDYEL